MPVPFRSVDELCAVLDDGHREDGYTALDHHLQCADILASEGVDIELRIAGLVHDVASSLDPRPSGDHAEIGAQLLRALLGDRVADLVAGHVRAKRYLVTVEPSYRALLNDDSTRTLARQGDTLTAEEVLAFERAPLADDWIALRRADDRAKIAGLVVPDLNAWRPLIDSVARRE